MPDLLAIAVVGVGFALCVAASRGMRLSGDEALNFQHANHSRLMDVYQSTVRNAHPPLFPLFLRFWKTLGNSEFFLRLPSIVFGGLFLWVAYRWVALLFGRLASLATLVLLTFSPGLISLFAQVRGYSLLLLLIAASALALERALRERRPAGLVASSALLALALLDQYAALFFAVASVPYALVRLRQIRSDPRYQRLVMVWTGSVLAVVTLASFLTITQLAHLRGSDLERGVKTRMLRTEYFQSDQDQVLSFLVRQTGAVFGFFSGSPRRGAVVFALAAAGIALLAKKRDPAVILLALPFFLSAVAALLGFYPYGGIRQSAYLLIFSSAAIGSVVAPVLAARRGAAVVIIPVLAASSLMWRVPPAGETGARMISALTRLHAEARPGSLLFVDLRAGTVLDYYLGRDAWSTLRSGRSGFWESSPGAYQILASGIWNFTGYQLGTELDRLIREYRLPVGQAVWLMNVETYLDVATTVSRRIPGGRTREAYRSGETSLVEVVLP